MGVTVSYNNSTITTMNASGTEILDTNGKLMADDITIEYSASSISLQAKTNITPTTSSQTITPDSGYDGLSSVQINAMPSGSATTPATTISTTPSISVSNSGLITATASATKSVTPTVSAGYVSSGTAGTITVSGSNTSQLTTQAATTYTPTTANQTIASGKYLTGAQTILGDANLTAENIKKDVSIFGVTGTYEGGGGSVPLTNVSIQWPDYTTMMYTDSSMQVQTMAIDSSSVYNLSLPANTLVAFYYSSMSPPGPQQPDYVNLTLWHTVSSRTSTKMAVYVVDATS